MTLRLYGKSIRAIARLLSVATCFGLACLGLTGCGGASEEGALEKRPPWDRGEPKASSRKGGIFSTGQKTNPGSYHYRVKASYTVKETGELLQFDHVVACGAVTTTWSYTGASTMATTNPIIMVKPTSNGGAVSLHNPIPICEYGSIGGFRYKSIEGRKRGIPSDFMPYVVWFDDVKDLSIGWGYVNEDAYYNANSQLEFIDASIEESNVEEWRAWREKAAAEYEQKGQLPGPWGYNPGMAPKEEREWVESLNGGRTIPFRCSLGYRRIPVPDDLMEVFWSKALETGETPDESGRYMIVKKWDWLADAMRGAGPVFGGNSYKEYIKIPLGVARRHFDDTDPKTRESDVVIADEYPVLSHSISTDPPITEPSDVYPMRILIDDAWKGMNVCNGRYRVPGPDNLISSLIDKKTGKKVFDMKKRLYVVDREKSFDPHYILKKFPLYINELIIDERTTRRTRPVSPPYRFILDRDGFVLNSTFR